MITPAQDINYFIERQRSKLNKTNARARRVPAPPVRARPPPPPVPILVSRPAEQLENRLDVQVSRLLDQPSPRNRSQQSNYSVSSRSLIPTDRSLDQQHTLALSDRQEPRRHSDTVATNNEFAFFNSFGTYEGRREQLRKERNREYNEYLFAQQDASRGKSSLNSTSMSHGNTTRRVRFQTDPSTTVIAPWEQTGNQTARNINNHSSLSSVSTSEHIIDRSRSRMGHGYDEQYIRDREEYILELYNQIRELEQRRRFLEAGRINLFV
jgi:hypothetical protein